MDATYNFEEEVKKVFSNRSFFPHSEVDIKIAYEIAKLVRSEQGEALLAYLGTLEEGLFEMCAESVKDERLNTFLNGIQYGLHTLKAVLLDARKL